MKEREGMMGQIGEVVRSSAFDNNNNVPVINGIATKLKGYKKRAHC